MQYNFSSILEEVVERLEYFSGKRACSASDFHRYSACTADMDMLRKLSDEALAWLALALAYAWKGSAISLDTLEITLDVPAGVSETEPGGSLHTVLRSVIIMRIILGWLRLAGHPEAVKAELSLAEMTELLNSKLRSFRSLKSRMAPPI